MVDKAIDTNFDNNTGTDIDTSISSHADDDISNMKQRRDLNDIMRRIRINETEQSEALEGLQSAEYARLEILRDELNDVTQQLPTDSDQFCMQIVPGNPPRFWLDILAHVRLAEDKRTYKLIKDTLYGRVVLFQTSGASQMADTIADYLADRLIERKKAIDFINYNSFAAIHHNNSKQKYSNDNNASSPKLNGQTNVAKDILLIILGVAIGIGISIAVSTYLADFITVSN